MWILIVLSEVGPFAVTQNEEKYKLLSSPSLLWYDGSNFKGCFQDDFVLWGLSLIKSLFSCLTRRRCYTRPLNLDHIAVYFTWPCAAIATCIMCLFFLLLGRWECSKLKVGSKINLNYPAIRLCFDVWRIAICQFFVDSLSLWERCPEEK